MARGKKTTASASAGPEAEQPGAIRIGAELVSFVRPAHLVDPSSAPFSLDKFNEEVSFDIKKLGKNFMEFDLVGLDCSIANSIRRVAVSEIPTMAIEHVFVINNTSIIPDEVLSHRLGLVPLYADPRKFDFKLAEQESTDVNTIVFELHEKCKKVSQDASLDPKEKFQNSSLYSSSLKWVPQGSQAEVFSHDAIKPAASDILLAKLRPGQEVELELHAVKGVGRDHAKWSPVSVAFYRLLPKITITKPIVGEEAAKFAKCFPKGVVEVETVGGVQTAVVKNARKDTVSRECLRHPEFVGKVILSREHNHFIFNLETVGFFAPKDIMIETFNILSEKCASLRNALDSL